MNLTRKELEEQQAMFNHYGREVLHPTTITALFTMALKASDEPKAEEAPAEAKPKRVKKAAE